MDCPFLLASGRLIMQRELSYQVSFKRLRKVGRVVCRKAFPIIQLIWLLLVLYFAALIGVVVFSSTFEEWFAAVGVRYGVEVMFVSLVLLALAGIWGLRRLQVNQVKARVDFDQVVRMIQDDNGIRFATDDTEYYFKWRGISQLLLVHDGVAVSHGALFFFIPDTAFAGAGDRLAFIREVYGRLSDKARSISEKHVRAALSQGEQPAAA
jgi:hypothetical protein